jgi:hypothetical protein
MDDFEVRVRDALAQAKECERARDRLVFLERELYRSVCAWGRAGGDAAGAERALVAAGLTPLATQDSLGRACQAVTCVVPSYERNLARHCGLEPFGQDRTGRLWRAPSGAWLDPLARWFPWQKMLALRAARGTVAADARHWVPNYSLERFVERLAGSHAWAQDVADKLKAAGVAASVSPYAVRDGVKDIARFARDETDLVLEGSGLGIEVKSRAQAWTSGDDFPFPTMFVDTYSGYLLKRKRPLAYVCVSQVKGTMSVIPTYTSAHWSCPVANDAGRVTYTGRRLRDRYWEIRRGEILPFGWLVKLCQALRVAADRAQVLRDHGYPSDLAVDICGPTTGSVAG